MTINKSGLNFLETGIRNYPYFNALALSTEALTLGIDEIRTSPLSSADNGYTQLLSPTASGDFSGFNNYIAQRFDDTWILYAPSDGQIIYIKEQYRFFRFDLGLNTWVPIWEFFVVAGNTSIELDAQDSRYFYLQLDGDTTIENLLNLSGSNIDNDGELFYFVFEQINTTTQLALTFGSKFVFASPPAAWLLSSDPNEITFQVYKYHADLDKLVGFERSLNIVV